MTTSDRRAASVSRFIDQCGVCRVIVLKDFFAALFLSPSLRDFLVSYLELVRVIRIGFARSPLKYLGKMRLRIHWILVSTAVILAGCNAATEVSTYDYTETKENDSCDSLSLSPLPSLSLSRLSRLLPFIAVQPFFRTYFLYYN